MAVKLSPDKRGKWRSLPVRATLLRIKLRHAYVSKSMITYFKSVKNKMRCLNKRERINND